MINTRSVINTAWMLSCQPERRRFERSLVDVAATQRSLLSEILQANANTAFGRDFGLTENSTFEQFTRQVPISTYEDLTPYIDRIAAGEHGVLTSERVGLLQPTSGSTGGRKLIPYTRTGQRFMQRSISAWIGDLFAGRPAVRRGSAYWSISPAFGNDELSSGGLKIGFADDTEYLGRAERRAVGRVLAVPPEVSALSDIAEFRQQTLAHLLHAEDLSLISVWSPTFLTALLAELFANPEATIRRLRLLDPNRATEVQRMLTSSTTRAELLNDLWPDLALISCWTDGSAATFVPAVRKLFPEIEIQPKGLLATEAFLTFPILEEDAAALAVRSHVFEFLPAGRDDAALPVLAHEVSVGSRYKPVITTAAGLYRYQMDDVVEVLGFRGTCPLLRFVGRDSTSDLVGEKLEETFVAGALRSVLGDSYHSKHHAMLVPEGGESPRYCLVLDSTPGAASLGVLEEEHSVGEAVDRALRNNPHYDHARNLNQLRLPRLALRSAGSPSVYQSYEEAMVRRGVRVGDIKPTSLVVDESLARELLQI